MVISRARSILAVSALLALGIGQGWAKPALPAGRILPEAPVKGTADGDANLKTGEAGMGNLGGQGPENGREPVKPAKKGPVKGEENPVEEEDSPAKEEKSDCDDCVIVRGEGGAAEAAGAPSTGGSAAALAGTLWGLFAVSRPRRTPRTIIRGVTVP